MAELFPNLNSLHCKKVKYKTKSAGKSKIILLIPLAVYYQAGDLLTFNMRRSSHSHLLGFCLLTSFFRIGIAQGKLKQFIRVENSKMNLKPNSCY